MEEKLNIYGIEPGSIVDGPGIRYTIFLQGCSHNCKGCHNPKSHSRINNIIMSVDDIINDFNKYPSSTSITFSGGEPFEQAKVLSVLAKKLKYYSINIWCYTGFTFNTLTNLANNIEDIYQSKFCNTSHNRYIKDLLDNIDVLVDGRFDYNQLSYDVLFRGSKNQRIIDVVKSRNDNSIVLWEKLYKVPTKPMSW